MTNRLTLPTPLVSTNWLAEHLGDPDLRVLDATAHLVGSDSGSTGWSLHPGALTSSTICPSPTGARSASLPGRGSPRQPADWVSARTAGL
jgi:hypothetical protein